ncbi:hypothetical protein NDU88_002517 [Pleurodeles waltl]|uniref:Uncharacterized protein n=1 Tax=Pleurodeles waltl TaxID=8319 RepID=A0AAV7T2C6_PLEWA|nr:hypothetical protein NDU88_002517 [Pleurodeles waltl]
MQCGLPPPTAEDQKGPVTRSFMETLFSSLRDDIQTVKTDLSAGLKDMWRNLEELSDKVSAMEDHKAECEEEAEWLHQEALRLEEQHIELQAHAEVKQCENQRGSLHVPREHVGALFRHILRSSGDEDIQLDRVHRVGPARPDNSPPTDILTCVHDFQLKETTRPEKPICCNLEDTPLCCTRT